MREKDDCIDFHWPQRTAQRITNVISDDCAFVHADAWQCAMEIAIALYRAPTSISPLGVLVITDDPGEVVQYASSLRRVLGEVRPDDPGWQQFRTRIGNRSRPKREITCMVGGSASSNLPVAIARDAMVSEGRQFRSICVLGLIAGAVTIMEQVLTHERAHGYGWARSQKFVMGLARRRWVAFDNNGISLDLFEAVYLRRNHTHRALMAAGVQFDVVVDRLVKHAINVHHFESSEITREELQALFGGQREAWISWLGGQLGTGDLIPRHRAAEWLATCV